MDKRLMKTFSCFSVFIFFTWLPDSMLEKARGKNLSGNFLLIKIT